MKRYYFDNDLRGNTKVVEDPDGGLVYYKDTLPLVEALKKIRDEDYDKPYEARRIARKALEGVGL